MKQIFVKDLKPGVPLSNIPFVVIKLEKKITKAGKDYMDITIGDKTGSIIGKIWSDKYDACSVDKLKEGSVVLLSGSAGEFMGKVQITITMAIIADQFDEEDFVPVTKKSIDELMSYLNEQIDSISDRHLRKLITAMLSDEKFLTVFKRTPAAMKLHHAYVGGLLEHICEMMRFAIPMCEVYQPCNCDLVKAGIILHDIGKTEEIVWKNMAIEYSDRGKLLGHVQLGLQIIDKYKQSDFDGECLALLQHIIIAHHGKIEYGAVVIPATIEAKIVSLADDSSAKLRGYMSLYEDGVGNGASFSEYSRTLETMVYVKEYQSALEQFMEKAEETNKKLEQLELL
ncbi:MAG: HD domain-containing protein [bacterium]|nr:HD domain-containing protein [bacterium]